MKKVIKKAGVIVTFKDKTYKMFNTSLTVEQLKEKIAKLLDSDKSHIAFIKGEGVVFIPMSELKDATIEIK